MSKRTPLVLCALSLILLVILGYWLKGFLEIDSCLDRGGAGIMRPAYVNTIKKVITSNPFRCMKTNRRNRAAADTKNHRWEGVQYGEIDG